MGDSMLTFVLFSPPHPSPASLFTSAHNLVSTPLPDPLLDSTHQRTSSDLLSSVAMLGLTPSCTTASVTILLPSNSNVSILMCEFQSSYSHCGRKEAKDSSLQNIFLRHVRI